MHTKDGVYRTIENDGGNFNVTEYAGTSHLTIQTNHSKTKNVCVSVSLAELPLYPPHFERLFDNDDDTRARFITLPNRKWTDKKKS